MDEPDISVDLVWLDHYLIGQETGLTIVAQLKQEDGPLRHIPIFVVTNTASEDNKKSYLALGVDRYYTKIESRLDDIVVDAMRMLKEQD